MRIPFSDRGYGLCIDGAFEGKGLPAHHSTLNSLAFSPDGKCLVSAGSDQTVKIWETTPWRQTAALTNFTKHVYSVAFSPGEDEGHIWVHLGHILQFNNCSLARARQAWAGNGSVPTFDTLSREFGGLLGIFRKLRIECPARIAAIFNGAWIQ